LLLPKAGIRIVQYSAGAGYSFEFLVLSF